MKLKDIKVGEEYAIGTDRWSQKAVDEARAKRAADNDALAAEFTAATGLHITIRDGAASLPVGQLRALIDLIPEGRPSCLTTRDPLADVIARASREAWDACLKSRQVIDNLRAALLGTGEANGGAGRHFKPGDRVAVDDPALAKLRAIMREHGGEPDPNNEGVVDEVRGDILLITFDDGQCAPYQASEATLIEEANGG